MKKTIVIILVITILVTVAAYASEHLVKVERKRTYSFGEDEWELVEVQTEETVYNILNGKEVNAKTYSTYVDRNDLPWYNVWTEANIELR